MKRQSRILVLCAALVAAGCMSASAIGTTYLGASGWEWSSPRPHGANVVDIAIADATHGYASTAGEGLLTTADAGATWASSLGDVGIDLRRVIPLTTSSLVALGDCQARRSDDGGATFRLLTFPLDARPCVNGGLRAASFATPQAGVFLMSNGTVVATGDGGATLTRSASIPAGADPWSALDVAMTSPTLGLAATSNGIVQTTDGGASWTPRLSGPPMWAVTFATSTTAYAIGPTAAFKSIDAGVTWSLLPNGAPAFGTTRIDCVTELLCLFGGSARTADGGLSFSALASTPTIRAAGFFTPSRAIAVGDAGRTIVSDDGGATWRSIDRRLTGRLTALRANADGLAYAWGPKGALAITLDRGATWRELTPPALETIRDVSFATPNVGFAVVHSGAVFATTTGGATWAALTIGRGFVPIGVHALDTRRILLLGHGGALRRSTDGGRTFVATGSARVSARAQRLQRAGSAVALHGTRGIAISTDGMRWTLVRSPIVNGRSRPLLLSQCTSTRVCWAVTVDRRLFRTVDAGRTWSERSAGIGSADGGIRSLAFASRTRGYLNSRLSTTDGGLTWTPAPVPAGPLVQASNGIDFGLTPRGLVTTTTGGLRGAASVLTLTPPATTISGRTSVTVTGRLSPAVGGEQILVSRADLSRRYYQTQTVRAASDGSFSATFTISRTTTFVAQWVGDATRVGDGSPPVIVRRR